MALLKQGAVVADPFTDVSQDDSISATGALIVSLAQWHEQREALAAREDKLGIILRSDEKPELIAADIAHFDVIALDFPAFGDGRAYSSARLLRDRYQYAGELRAVGDVLLEQLHFMNRVGFDAYEIASEHALKDWIVAAADISIWYQPTGDGRTPVVKLRHS